MDPHIREVEVLDFELREQSRVDEELFLQQVNLEESRLDHLLSEIGKAEETLKRTTSTRKATSLLTKIEELKQEQSYVLQRLETLAQRDIKPSYSLPDASSEGESSNKDFSCEDNQLDPNIHELRTEVIREAVISSESYCNDSIEQNLKNRLETSPISSDFLFFPLDQQSQLYTRFPCVSLNSFYVSSQLFEKLFPYQREGIRWLLSHFSTKSGGILGDEMGLGKTTQVIGFLSSIFLSGHLSHPALIVAPATLLQQWINEFHCWFPFMRILLLHDLQSTSEFRRIMNLAFSHGHVVVTSYGYLRKHADTLIRAKWKVVILDEGHGIRNPSTEVSQVCRRFRCTRRFILSGTPIQNNLLELWSLMDFCQPGLLGSMFAFKTAFSDPIRTGGFVNATHLQIQAAQQCSLTLKDRIEPFLMRRLKIQVAKQLPSKTEKILLCELTTLQRSLYEEYLGSDDVQLIYKKRKNVLAGIDVLRKICNHPKLLLLAQDNLEDIEDDDYFHKPSRESFSTSNLNQRLAINSMEDSSGKIQALHKVLQGWHDAGDRCLLFCQTRQMLDIIQEALISWNFTYSRMDGTTPISQRTLLIDRFNNGVDCFAFLLTTRVGGLGINLTGANRVLIFDPDWNPATDLQARERAWRLGQTRPVTVYRMIAAGSIEEKIYQRQIYKQHLTKKILQDPNAASTLFSTSDLYDLFAPLPRTRVDTLKEEDALFESRPQIEPDGSIIESELLNVNNVPTDKFITKRSNFFGREAELVAKNSLSLVSDDESKLKFKLSSILKTGPKETKVILDELGEYVDPVFLKNTIKSVAYFDREQKKWTHL